MAAPVSVYSGDMLPPVCLEYEFRQVTNSYISEISMSFLKLYSGSRCFMNNVYVIICSIHREMLPAQFLETVNELSGLQYGCDVTITQWPPSGWPWLQKRLQSWCKNTVSGACSGMLEPANQSRLGFVGGRSLETSTKIEFSKWGWTAALQQLTV